MSEDTNPQGSATAADPIAMISEQLERERDPTPASTKSEPAPSLTDDEPETAVDDEPSSPDDTDDDAPDDSPDEPTEPEPRKFTVKINGETREVTEQELIKGYQLEADYRAKTSEVAAQRKAIEAEAQRIASERAYYAQQLSQYQQSLSIPPEPDPRLIDANPQEYLRQRASWEQGIRQYQQVQAEQQQLAQQVEADQRQSYERHLKSELERLQEALPDWRDPKKASAEKKQLTEYLRKAGYSDDEIGSATDHRAIVLARKAALYDKLMASKPSVEQRIQTAPKTLRPGSTDPGDTLAAQRKAQWKQLERKGGVDAAAALIALG